jgi:predicted GIY-YIG superfamily endonuclease
MAISNVSSGLRFCPSCSTHQELTNYTIRKNGRIVAYCKPCNAQRTKKYRENNREKYLQAKREARQRWKEKNSVVVIRKNWDNLSIEEKEKQQCGIYCITIGEKFYIGSCVNFNRRMKDHTRKLGYGTHINKKMQAAFDKYQTFNVEIIEHCDPVNLVFLEQKHINQWFNDERCLNLRMEAVNCLGMKHSEETKKKISEIVSQRYREINSGNK